MEKDLEGLLKGKEGLKEQRVEALQLEDLRRI